MSCVFCKIINRELPADIVFENERVLAFKDINPEAPIHYLIVPKKHIESIESPNSEKAAADLILAAKEISQGKGIKGYKLIFNVGREGGQIIDHLHLHFLAGWPSGKK